MPEKKKARAGQDLKNGSLGHLSHYVKAKWEKCLSSVTEHITLLRVK